MKFSAPVLLDPLNSVGSTPSTYTPPVGTSAASEGTSTADSRSRFELSNDALEGVADISSEEMTQLRGFLAQVNTATGGDEEISTFLQKGAHLEFVDDEELTEGVISEYDPETGNIRLPVSMAEDALETLGKLPEGAIGADGTVDPEVLASNKDLLKGVNELNTLVAHEYEHLEDADTGEDDDALRLAQLIETGEWDLDQTPGNFDRELVDAVVTTFKMNRGLFKELEGIEVTDAGHHNGNNVGTAAMTSVLREYGAHLVEEQRLTKLAEQGLVDPSEIERFVTDESGQPLDYQTAVKNLLDLSLKPSEEGGGGLLNDVDTDNSDSAGASRGDSQLTTSANYDPNFKDPRRNGRSG